MRDHIKQDLVGPEDSPSDPDTVMAEIVTLISENAGNGKELLPPDFRVDPEPNDAGSFRVVLRSAEGWTAISPCPSGAPGFDITDSDAPDPADPVDTADDLYVAAYKAMERMSLRYIAAVKRRNRGIQ